MPLTAFYCKEFTYYPCILLCCWCCSCCRCCVHAFWFNTPRVQERRQASHYFLVLLIWMMLEKMAYALSSCRGGEEGGGGAAGISKNIKALSWLSHKILSTLCERQLIDESWGKISTVFNLRYKPRSIETIANARDSKSTRMWQIKEIFGKANPHQGRN